MTGAEFYRLIAPVNAEIRCGHTAVRLPATKSAEINEQPDLIPLKLKVIGSGIFVRQDLSANELTGAQVESVNGVSSGEMLRRLGNFIPRDANVQSSLGYILSRDTIFNQFLCG